MPPTSFGRDGFGRHLALAGVSAAPCSGRCRATSLRIDASVLSGGLCRARRRCVGGAAAAAAATNQSATATRYLLRQRGLWCATQTATHRLLGGSAAGRKMLQPRGWLAKELSQVQEALHSAMTARPTDVALATPLTPSTV